jgi:hypothetical protein
MEKDKLEEIYQAFKEEVNMTPASLEKWLETDESKLVGWDSGDGESIGHKSGERIVELLAKKKAELTDADYEHMQKVHGYIKRHMVQRPHDPANSKWDYSLRNWGHDFSKK